MKKIDRNPLTQVSAWQPWVLPAAILLVWQLYGTQGLVLNILPTPLDVLRAFIDSMLSQSFWEHLYVSTRRAFTGFLIGGSLAFSLGLLNGLFRVSESYIDSTLQMLRNIPHLALIPLVILWFGIGETSKVFLVAVGVVFPIYMNTFHGIRAVSPGLVEMGRVYGLNHRALFFNIILPSALPSILLGVRFSLGIMWMTLIVSETIAADAGIGYLATHAREFMHMDIVVLCIILYALLGKASDLVAKAFERRLLRWHHNYVE